MPVVRVLLLTHLGLTALLLVLFALVVVCQRLSARARPSAAATPPPAVLHEPYPAEPSATGVPALPVQTPAARREQPAAAASVLQWTLDLRAPAPSAARSGEAALQGSS